MAEEKGTQQGRLIVGALGGGLMGVVTGLLMSKPAAAAPPELKQDYLIELLETLVQGNVIIIEWLTKINAAQGVPGEPGVPGVEVTVITPWVAKEPVQIYQQAIRSVGVFQSDVMVDMRNVKRLTIRAESSLDQAVTLQLVGNFVDSFNLAVNVGPPAVCPINGQAGIGLAWGDWQPYIGVVITAAIAPTIGLLTISVVVQE